MGRAPARLHPPQSAYRLPTAKSREKGPAGQGLPAGGGGGGAPRRQLRLSVPGGALDGNGGLPGARGSNRLGGMASTLRNMQASAIALDEERPGTSSAGRWGPAAPPPLRLAPRPTTGPVVVDLLSDDDGEDATGPVVEVAGASAVSLRRLERDQGRDGPLGGWQPFMAEPVRQVKFGSLDAGPGRLKICAAGLHVTFPVRALSGQAADDGWASLRVNWEALQYFKICSTEHAEKKLMWESATGLVVFSFPHELRSLKNDYDVLSSDRRQRFVVLEMDPASSRENGWPALLVKQVKEMEKSNAAIRKLCYRGEGKCMVPTVTMDSHFVRFFFREIDAWEGERKLGADWFRGCRYSTRIAGRSDSGKFQAAEKGIQNPFVYPRQGHPRAVKVYPEDLTRLRGSAFLNDTLIDFYMEYIRHDMFPQVSKRVHVFNSFFYKKLTQEDGWGTGGVPGAAGRAERAHKRVSRWTQDVNIFEKDFVVVPINTYAHWYLAIICHPGEVTDDGSRDGLTGIVVLDSLGGDHAHAVRHLKDYLTWERHRKVGGGKGVPALNFRDVGVVRDAHPCVPQQTNFHDCGLFLLHYAELFFKECPTSVRLPTPRAPLFPARQGTGWPYIFRENWFRPAAASAAKRQHIMKIIQDIGPRLEIQDSLAGDDALFSELEALPSTRVTASDGAPKPGMMAGELLPLGAENVPPADKCFLSSRAAQGPGHPEEPGQNALSGSEHVLLTEERSELHLELEVRERLPRSRQEDPKLVWRQTPPGAEAPARRFKRLRRAS